MGNQRRILSLLPLLWLAAHPAAGQSAMRAQGDTRALAPIERASSPDFPPLYFETEELELPLAPPEAVDTASPSGFSSFVQTVSSFFQVDTTKRRRFSLLALPEFSYGDEDGLGVGFTARLYINDFRPHPQGKARRQSYVDFSSHFTFKGNLSLSLRPTVYLLDERLLLRGYFGLGHYPSTFQAIGPDSAEDQKEDYDERSTRFRLATYWRWFENVYIGLGYYYYDYQVKDILEGGMLDQGTIPGCDGARISGLSLHYIYDSRDDPFVPLKGFYAQLDGYFNAHLLGSTQDYTKYLIDLRGYIPVGKDQLIALNFYSQIATGEVPFQDMASLSNGIHSRGYASGRYIDKNLMSLQAEYRYYFGRFGISAFAGTANVGDTPLKALKMDKFTFGGGLRLKPFRGQRMYFRGDVGFNTHGDVQFYLGIDELF